MYNMNCSYETNSNYLFKIQHNALNLMKLYELQENKNNFLLLYMKRCKLL